MKAPEAKSFSPRPVFSAALKYSFPVLLGYAAIGVAFGLMLQGAGYPWWLALVMSVWMYAGAGQYIAVGLFSAGTSLWEACLVQLVVNARHIAYGLSMLGRFRGLGAFRPYLIFSMTDETFALLSSLPEEAGPFAGEGEKRKLFMFYVAALDHSYWILGSVFGAIAGTLIPFDMAGIDFALSALFIVLLIEQIKRVRKPGIFAVSAAAALAGTFFFPERIALLASLGLSLALSPLAGGRKK